MNDLQLKVVTSERVVDPEQLQPGSVVEVYSQRFEETLELKVTHLDPTYGGTIVDSPTSPLLGEADHVHFSIENVITIQDP
ncbi:MAG: hypothetical protein ABEK50_14510 [bacterium]